MLTTLQKRHIRKFINNLKEKRRRHTELITVYVPVGYDIIKIIQHLAQEQGTATNIKSSSTRKNVTDALERMIQHLRLYKETPPNGLAVFSGNVSEREGMSDVQVYAIEPPLPLNQRLYRCEKEFVTEAIEEMLDDENTYGLVVMDRRDAIIATLKGKKIQVLTKTHSEVPGKFRAGGQCLDPETLIMKGNGTIMPIGSVSRGDSIIAMDERKQSIVAAEVIDRWDTLKESFIITTKHPIFSITASKDHLFFVATKHGIEERAAQELNKDDVLLIPESVPVTGTVQYLQTLPYDNSTKIPTKLKTLIAYKRKEKGLRQKDIALITGVSQTTISSYELGKLNARPGQLLKICSVLDIDPIASSSLPYTLTAEYAQILGYLTGDGCIETDRISFYEQDEDVAQEYLRLSNKVFSICPSIRFRESKKYYQTRIGSRPVVRQIRGEFPEIKLSATSTIPEKIMVSPQVIVAGYLRGIFDADGWCSDRIGICLYNEKLIREIQLVMLRLGILSSYGITRIKNPYSNNNGYRLEINDKQSLQRFQERIGFTSKRKQKKLKEIIDVKSSTNHMRQIAAPGTFIRKVLEDNNIGIATYNRSLFFHNKRRMSKEAFTRMISDVPMPAKKILDTIKEYPMLPVRVSKIVPAGKKRLVDISTVTESFFANGIAVHNSAARFARQREGAAKDHYNKVGEYMKEQYLNMQGLKGIIVGGPGPTKYEFVDGNHITDQVKRKVIGIKDLSYTDEFGLQELVDKSQDILADEEIAQEKAELQRFFGLLAKKPGMVSYGKSDVKKHLVSGAVEVLMVSETVDDDTIEEYEGIAEQYGTKIMITSPDTREGKQLEDIGRYAAILRFEVQN
ncbi:MAG: LAGLIDADG family homing endonuclease [Candidatus Woesearchaeota archaeon]